MGDMVAALVKGSEEEENWILAEVVQFNPTANKYEVDDIDEEQKDRHVLSKRRVVPLPLMRANPETDAHALFPKGSIGVDRIEPIKINNQTLIDKFFCYNSYGAVSPDDVLLQSRCQSATNNSDRRVRSPVRRRYIRRRVLAAFKRSATLRYIDKGK